MTNTTGGSIVWNLDVQGQDEFNRKVDASKSKIEGLGDKARQEGTSMSNAFRQASENILSGFKEIGVVGLALGGGFLAFAGKAAFASARIDELTLALHAVAKANNVSTGAADKAVQSLRDNNIAYKDSLQSVVKLVSAGIELEGNSERLARTAKDVGIGYMGSSEAFNLLTDAIVTNNTQQLGSLGIVTTQTLAFKTYADTVGKSVDELTAQERQLAIMNVVFAEGEKRVGAYDAAQQSASKQWGSLTTRIIPDFIALMGKAFDPALLVIVNTLTLGIKELSKWIEANKAQLEIWGLKIALAVAEGAKFAYGVIKWLIDNKDIVLNFFIAMGIAVGVLAASFLIVHWPALLVITALTAIITIGQMVIDKMGGLDNIIKILQPTLNMLYITWSQFIYPALFLVWKTFTTQLIPALTQLCNLIKPVVIPILQFLGIILMEVVFVAIMGVILVIGTIITAMSNWVRETNSAINQIKGFFEGLWRSVKPIIDAMARALQSINPFHRNSPSLVDNIKAGVGVIKDEYSKLGDIKFSPVSAGFDFNYSGSAPEMAGNTNTNTVNHAPVFNVSLGNFIGTEVELREFSKRMNDSYQNYLKGRGQS